MFESGEVKFVILRLLKEKPRHGYEIIKALEEKLAGTYSPSAGTVYPTLQLVADQGYVRVVEEICGRGGDAVRDFAGGPMGELHQAFARVASVTYKRAWRWGGSHPAVPRIVEILKRTADDIEKEWEKV